MKIIKNLNKIASHLKNSTLTMGDQIAFNKGYLYLPHNGKPNLDRYRNLIEENRNKFNLPVNFDIYNLQSRNEFHVTLVSPPELRSIKNYLGVKKVHFSDYGIELDQYNTNILFKGIGYARKGDNVVFFLVAEWPGGRKFREDLAKKLNLPPLVFDPQAQHFHLTLFFKENDIFGVNKNEVILNEV